MAAKNEALDKYVNKVMPPKKEVQPDLPLADSIINKPLAASAMPSTNPVVSTDLNPLETVKSRIGGVKIPTQIGDKVVDVKIDTPAITDKAVKPALTTPQGAQAVTTQAEQKAETKPAQQGGGMNWLAALMDIGGAGAHGYAGVEHKGGYLDQLAAQQQADADRKAQIDAMKAKYGLAAGGATAGSPGTIIPGYKPVAGVQLQKQGIDDAQKIAAAKGQSMSGLGQLESFLQKHPDLNALNQAELKEFETLKGGVVGNMRTAMLGPGAMSDGERQYLQNLLPKYLDPLEDKNTRMRKLNAVKNMVSNGANAQLNSYGFEPEEGGAPKAQQYQEGMTATNKATGQKLVFKGGQWVPVK